MPTPLTGYGGGQASSATPGGFAGFAGGTNSTNGLMDLANAQGGSIAEAANSLVHPQTSILSTISDDFKQGFKKFVDTISVPSNVVAGTLKAIHEGGNFGQDISDAVANHTTPDQVLFGTPEKTDSTLKKIGGFLVRTATDVLLDPLTYLTFGVGEGIFGLRSASRITLGEASAAYVGQSAMDAIQLNKTGQDMYAALNAASREIQGGAIHAAMTSGDPVMMGVAKTAAQGEGSAMMRLLESGNEDYVLAGKELQKVLDNTVDTPFGVDYAKRALSNLFEAHPALLQTYMDKGGIKIFGKSIVSSQRVGAAMKMLPGMSAIDHVVTPYRKAAQALFDPSMVKEGGTWYKTPEEYQSIFRQGDDLAKALGDSRAKYFGDVVKANKLDINEAKYLSAAVEAGKLPADPRLANAFKQLTGFNSNELKFLKDSGFQVSRLENHVPHIFQKQKISTIPFGKSRSDKAVAAINRKLEGPMMRTAENIPEELGSFARLAQHSRTPEEFGENLTANASTLGEVPSEVSSDLKKFHTQANTTLSDVEKAVTGTDKNQVHIDQMFEDITRMGFEGFDKNIVTALARRSFSNVQAGVSRQFMRSIAEAAGVHESEAGPGWRALNSTGMREAGKNTSKMVGKDEGGLPVAMDAEEIMNSVKAPDGSQLFYHPAMAKRIESTMSSMINDDATNEFLKNFDRIQNLFKASVTEMFPAFHGRNAISNVFLHYLDLGVNSLDPSLHTMAGDMVYKDRTLRSLQTKAVGVGADAETARAKISEIMNKTYFTDRSGYQWTYGELRAVAKNNNVAFTHSVTTPADITEEGGVDLVATNFPKGTVSKYMSMAAPTSRQFLPFRVGSQIGNAFQEQARLIDFIANLRHTSDVQVAALRSKQFIFDHTFLTPFEKNVLRRIIPFYAFTRKNIERQVASLATTPGRVAAEAQAVGTLGEVISGGQTLTPEQQAALPDYLKEGQQTLLGSKGNTLDILGDFGFPVEQPFHALQPNMLLSSLSPIIRLPAETMSGYSFFNGKPLSEVTNAQAFKNAPGPLKSLIGYTEVKAKTSDGRPYTLYVSLHPSMMNLLLNLPPTSRVLSSLKQIDQADTTGSDKALQSLLGVHIYSVDWQKEAQKQAATQKSELESLLQKAGVVYTFTQAAVPKAKF